jgi:hypothetical protein
MSENELTSEKYNPREQRLFDQICERDKAMCSLHAQHAENIRELNLKHAETVVDMLDHIDWMTDRVATATFWMRLKYLLGGKL